MRVTRDGILFVVLATALTGVAMISGNNLLFLVVAPLWSVWLLQWPLGRLNTRGLRVRRALPAELYAGHGAVGAWVVVNGRRWLSARDLRVSEGDGQAAAEVDRVGPRSSGRVPATWRFPRRGLVALDGVVVASSWPFGLVEQRVALPLPGALVVYPRPLPGRRSARPRHRAGLAEVPLRGGGGDFLGIRSYRDGDPPRRIHWPTTARLGRPMVVERAQERERVLEIVLHDRRGDHWEREVSRACGEVHRALDRGEAVGLRVPRAEGLEPIDLAAARGASWRRTLLDTLARLPERT